jgi:hypothetical protein
MYSFHAGASVFTGRNYKLYLDINTSCLLRYYNHMSDVHYFYWSNDASQNSRRQKGDIKQISFWGPTIIRRHPIQFSRQENMAPIMCVLLLYIFFLQNFPNTQRSCSVSLESSLWNLDCNLAIYKIKPIFLDIIRHTNQIKKTSDTTLNVDFMWATGNSWSQWPRGLRRRSSAARLLRLWFRIPPGGWMFVCCECCVLSGRGFCDGLITRP